MSTSAPQQTTRRAIRLLFLLKGHAFNGLRLKQLAEAAEQSPSTTLRDLEVLADEGVVERLANDKDRWRLTPKVIQLAIAHQAEMAALQQRVDDTTQRYSRSSI
jgi:DNA-binding IclR family transcriptional regulator